LKVLNYMAAGLPIVSFEGSAAGLVHDRTALTVPDGDVAQFGEAIGQLLDNRSRAEELGAAARARVVAEHSWERVAEQVEAVYGTLRQPPNLGQ
jgi:glycosyltransferase involved in cell wall biosynthesis